MFLASRLATIGGDSMNVEHQTELPVSSQPSTRVWSAPQRPSPEANEHALRNVAWVAEFLGVSKSWVYQATANGVS